jgi:hypothetical protein
MSQETLAEMIGTTRSRVSFFVNRFRKLGFIEYDGGSGLQVHSALLKHHSPRLELRSEKNGSLLSYRRTVGPLPFRDGSSVLLGPQMSTGSLWNLGQRASPQWKAPNM